LKLSGYEIRDSIPSPIDVAIIIKKPQIIEFLPPILFLKVPTKGENIICPTEKIDMINATSEELIALMGLPNSLLGIKVSFYE